MTNSQNRPSNGGNRYSSGGGQIASPQQQQHQHQHHHHQKVPQMGGYGSGGSAMATTPPNGGHMKGGMGGGSARKSRNQRSPSGATYFASQSMLVFTPVKQQQHKMSVTPTGQHQMSSSPPNLSHFAGSKCYEAPAPTALPRPPDHWKLPTSASKGLTIPQKVMFAPKATPQTCGGVFNDGKSDIFSQNLKMLLNIKA